MKTILPSFCIALLALPTFSSAAEPADNAESQTWEVSAELGALITTGNTESTSFMSKLTAKHQLQDWKNKYTFASLFRENETTTETGEKITETSAEQYSITAQGDYIFSETSAAFIFASYTDDKFGAFSQYSTVAAGYSFRAIKNESLIIDLSVGPGFSSNKTQSGVKEDGFVARLSSDLEWKISSTAKFTQNISIEAADFNTRTSTESALVSSINADMKMKFGFKTLTNSDVEDGREKTDTETSATIIINF